MTDKTTTLYIRPGACSLAVHIVLSEVCASFDIAAVDLLTKRLRGGGDYREINPKRQVPALRLKDGSLLTEGPAINQYIADHHPAAGLLSPVGTMDRYHMLEWLNFVATELQKTISPLMRPGLSNEDRERIVTQVGDKLGIVKVHLADRSFLVDSGFSIADAYLFVMFTWLPLIGITPELLPNLAAFAARVGARPALAAALAAERHAEL